MARPDQPEMNLPAGYTCAECKHHPRCVALFGCAPTNTHCDWSPSRFALVIPVRATASAYDLAGQKEYPGE